MQPPPGGGGAELLLHASSTSGTVHSWVSSCLHRTQLTRPFPARRLQVAASPRGRDQQAAWTEISGRRQPCQAPQEEAGALSAPLPLGGGNPPGFLYPKHFLAV